MSGFTDRFGRLVSVSTEDGFDIYSATGAPTVRLPAGTSSDIARNVFDAHAPADYVAPVPVPESVTLKQLLFALTAAGFISGEEAIAAARTGDLPATLAAGLTAGMSPEEIFGVQLTWAAMYTAERASPLWDVVIAKGIATTEQIDAVFQYAVTV